MGIAKSLRKINYNLGLDKLANALTKLEKEKQQEDMFKAIGDAFNEYKQNQSIAGTELTGQVTNPFQPTISNPLQLNVPNVNTDASNVLSQPILPNTLQLPQSANVTIPEPQTRQLSPQDTYLKAKQNYTQFADKVMPTILNRYADADVLRKLGTVLGQAKSDVAMMKPEKLNLMQRNPYYDLINQNTAETIKEGRDRAKLKTIKNGETGTYWNVDETTGTGIDTGVPFPQPAPKSNVSAARLDYTKQKDKEKKIREKAKAKAEYESIISAPAMTPEEFDSRYQDGYDYLKRKGIVDKNEDGTYTPKQDSVYVYQTGKKLKVFKSRDELKKFADNKLGHILKNVDELKKELKGNKTGTKKYKNAVYKDKNGKRIIYYNGEWLDFNEENLKKIGAKRIKGVK